jgi:monoamine oxidase
LEQELRITAIELERLGFNPIVIEASDRVGGRVKQILLTDFI